MTTKSTRSSMPKKNSRASPTSSRAPPKTWKPKRNTPLPFLAHPTFVSQLYITFPCLHCVSILPLPCTAQKKKKSPRSPPCICISYTLQKLITVTLPVFLFSYFEKHISFLITYLYL
ncbi:hypothetical protein M413DRAFT_110338 [Hebeloma cylindrosporum]|uniref:Uncharacterized protein n=1 Tax=Hebeloma cylindrosporum TaxID=76867 RepID=A0A0C3CLE3_HEBCY|nr:hypothetical protein M413DRAFT_110338 [Hebeloma cylindrosporum h7]